MAPRKAEGPVNCGNDGCTKTWPRDPVLEVVCPKCAAPIGSRCVTRRPSEHVHSASFSGLPDWGHDERDLLAAKEGHYGVCPLRRCGGAAAQK